MSFYKNDFRLEEKLNEFLSTAVSTMERTDMAQPHTLLIDDNMYYRSMRYQYFQLARKCKYKPKVATHHLSL